MIRPRALSCTALALLVATLAVAQEPLEDRAPAALAAELRELAAAAPGDLEARVVVFGRSLEDRELLALEIGPRDEVPPARDDDPGVLRRSAGRRPAVLLVAGLEADRPLGPVLLVRLARDLLALDEGVLADRLAGGRLYLVPLVDPDGAQRRFDGTPLLERAGNARVIDRDRDGRAPREDPPLDLDGDGLILTMRVRDERGAFVEDPEHPGLMRPADPERGENGVWRLLDEGRDQDGDGAFAEEPAVGVDLARNFPHAFREHDPDVGRLPMSEPETRALADYVLARPEIGLAVVYGGHDDLTEPPRAAGADEVVPGRRAALSGVDPADLAIWTKIAEHRRASGAVMGRSARDPQGSLAQWLYHQLGVPAVSVSPFHVPERADEAEDADDAGADAVPAGGADATAADGQDGQAEAADPASDASPADDAIARAIARARRDGFVPWRPFTHDQLGAIEIGGWRPFARSLPDPATAALVAERERAFVLGLPGMLPRLTVDPPVVRRLAPGLHEITLRASNTGGLPTATAQGRRARTVGPVIAIIDLPEDRVVQGDRRTAVDGLAAGSGELHLRWLVRGASGSRVRIVVGEERAAALVEEVTLP